MEDEVAIDGGGVLHVFLDDCGNVVRQWRVQNDGSEDNYDGACFERLWKDNFPTLLVKLVLRTMRVEAEAPHTLFEVPELLGSTCT